MSLENKTTQELIDIISLQNEEIVRLKFIKSNFSDIMDNIQYDDYEECNMCGWIEMNYYRNGGECCECGDYICKSCKCDCES